MLRGLRAPSAKAGPGAVADILTRIEAHLTRHDGYVAFSGGKDSPIVLALARRVEPDVPVVFFDSGLDYPETYDYLTELAPRDCRPASTPRPRSSWRLTDPPSQRLNWAFQSSAEKSEESGLEEMMGSTPIMWVTAKRPRYATVPPGRGSVPSAPNTADAVDSGSLSSPHYPSSWRGDRV